MNSQHENKNLDGDFVLKNRVKTFVLMIFKVKSDSKIAIEMMKTLFGFSVRNVEIFSITRQIILIIWVSYQSHLSMKLY